MEWHGIAHWQFSLFCIVYLSKCKYTMCVKIHCVAEVL